MSNLNTNPIKMTIGVILNHIFDSYRKITLNMLTQSEDIVKQMSFDVNTPIYTVFNDVDKLGDIPTAALNPYTNQQYINLAWKIINKTGWYKIGLQ